MRGTYVAVIPGTGYYLSLCVVTRPGPYCCLTYAEGVLAVHSGPGRISLNIGGSREKPPEAARYREKPREAVRSREKPRDAAR